MLGTPVPLVGRPGDAGLLSGALCTPSARVQKGAREPQACEGAAWARPAAFLGELQTHSEGLDVGFSSKFSMSFVLFCSRLTKNKTQPASGEISLGLNPQLTGC